MGGIDFFDVDHTITRRSSGGRYITLGIQRGFLPLKLTVIIPWYTFTYRLGFFKLKEYAEGFPYLRGIPLASLERLAHESFEAKLRGDIYDGARAMIDERKREGHRVYLATSSLDFIVAPLASSLGVDGTIATRLEFQDGLCTGRMVGAPMFRGEKQRTVLQFIAQEGEKPEDCSFYSDSIYDLPLLEAVGRPVAVNPDVHLRRLAKERGWPIIDLK